MRKQSQHDKTVYVDAAQRDAHCDEPNNVQKTFSFDVHTFLFFLTWTLISCPPNILWQIYLEEKYPANKADPQQQSGKRLSKTNTTKKFLLDQLVGATLNTVGYIAALAAFRGKDGAGIVDEVQNVCTQFIRI